MKTFEQWIENMSPDAMAMGKELQTRMSPETQAFEELRNLIRKTWPTIPEKDVDQLSYKLVDQFGGLDALKVVQNRVAQLQKQPVLRTFEQMLEDLDRAPEKPPKLLTDKEHALMRKKDKPAKTGKEEKRR